MPRHCRRFVLLLLIAILPTAIAQDALARRSAHRSHHRGAPHSSAPCSPGARSAATRKRHGRRGAQVRHARHAHHKGHHRRNRGHRNQAMCAAAHIGSRHKTSTAPADTALPSISGSPVEGQVLSASSGSWTGATPIHYAYQWQRAGADVSGATGSSYTLSSADVGAQIDVVVTASNSIGSSSATSPATAVVTALSSTELASSSSTVTSSSTESVPAPSVEGSVVNAAPTGPPVPAGGWHVAFADGFATKLGYGPGEDNFWFTNKEEPANTYQSGLNSNELQVFNSSADRVGPEGLELLETYTPDAGGTGKNYVGGLVNTAYHATGQQPFSWKSGGASTWAFECVCKWPHNTGEADPGWWSDATVNGEENEIDFFEGFGWGKTWHEVKEWSAAMPTVVNLNYHTVYGVEKYLGFDPTAGYHRYTTTLTPNGTKTIIAEYVDGLLKWSYEVEYPASRKTFTHLVLSYALREYPENFKEGTRTFNIRSVAVYQDANHSGQETEGGGIAPGTTIK